MKGLTVNVLRSIRRDSRGGFRVEDFSNGGVTSKFDEFVLVDPAIDEVFEATADRPALKLVRRNIGGQLYIHAEPLEPVNNKTHMGYTFGGNFVTSSDSRISAINNYPIPVHDRKDTWADYNRMSI